MAGLTFRAPYGAVGHGGHYHSQSPEAYFTHTPGLKVVVPRDPVQAKGLLLASIRDPDPVLFLEPKALYRASVGDVPTGDYTLPLGKADVVREGSDVTVIGWGAQMRVLEAARRCAPNSYYQAVPRARVRNTPRGAPAPPRPRRLSPWAARRNRRDACCAATKKNECR